jgi:hypothetical protein
MMTTSKSGPPPPLSLDPSAATPLGVEITSVECSECPTKPFKKLL